ncbi:MAG: polysaccharide deacetylase family protein [Bacteroidia bacterium]
MILVFTTQKSPRLDYILAELLGRRAGFEWQVTTDENEFLNFSGPKINYSENTFEDHIRIKPNGLLFETEIHNLQMEVKEDETWNKILFEQNSTIPFDIFSASFYLLSRYEEFLPTDHDLSGQAGLSHKKDEHGRYDHRQSLAFQNHFIETPLVDIWTQKLKEKILEKFPSETFRQNQFKFLSTIDIDFAYKYKGIRLTRHLLKFGKSVLQFRFLDADEQIQVVLKFKKDPYNTYRLIENISSRSSTETLFFVLMRTGTKHDKNILPESNEMKFLVKKLSKKFEIGLHPSYFAEENKIEEEKSLLEKLTGKIISISRHHFLSIRLPKTYQRLISSGIIADYSMAYSGICGFRASTCFPFNFFDLSQNRMTNLVVHPTTVMDVTLKNSQKLKPEEANQKILKLMTEVKKVSGTFISLWHNSSLCEDKEWKGWTKVFENLHTLAAEISLQKN